MQACGLIVEYNPFHNGHVYHIQASREASGADCLIAVMSGSFLQRGEPAIIDKFHRAKAALSAGVDIVLELPYLYAVQSSDLFARGSVHTLNAVGVSSICFGSESGNISHFTKSYDIFKQEQSVYKTTLHEKLNQGLAFPEASRLAYQSIGLTTSEMNLAKPNNILGFSYVKTILDHKLPIDPLTITRTKSGYHDKRITDSIASATSIRNELIKEQSISDTADSALPEVTVNQLKAYQQQAALWHSWEHYFNLLHYRVMTMSQEELADIHGVDEGLEYRIKKSAQDVSSFHEWMNSIKTKRYTWTRLQRIFTHVLTNTKKTDADYIKNASSVPYVRLLGMTKTGQKYLNSCKKEMDVPLISSIIGITNPTLSIEEKASRAYYSILPAQKKKPFHHQELQPPVMV
ncbi:Predicted nucleotidyltransferase [Lentibacillus halodurans]|uniref:tRNA(Met) cytidine acetate ligase n=1 Tax=Lentibacillus halodurans TaxID=237679 RepID=A0A1I0YZ53_9BACI|nr:nucleotidyltransferase [Lentibacillus halodurans]SFB18719.1 Predicted nucleotidyltransferase [Lentibacillus halodurans]